MKYKTLEEMAEERIARLREEVALSEIALHHAKAYKDYDKYSPERRKIYKQKYNVYMCQALGLNIQREKE